MKTFIAVIATAPLVAAIGATSSGAAPKPGFAPGTWDVTGTMRGTSTDYGQTIDTKGTFKFTLRVTKAGGISGTGTWQTTAIGSGAISSKITGFMRVTLSGTPTDVRYSGNQTLTMHFTDGVASSGNTVTRKKVSTGKLVIKKALSCKVTGGHTNHGVVTTWTATLKGVTCVS